MRIYPPAWLFMSIVLMIGLHVVVPGVRWLPEPWSFSGALVLLAGVTICVIAAWKFHRRRTTVNPFAPATVLVTDGPYRFSRNPMYLGMILCLLGIGLVQGTLVPLAVIPAFTWIMARWFIRQEEQALGEQFGLEYQNYKKRVRRWL